MLYLTLNLRRRWALRRTPAGPLRDYLETPFPKPSADCRDLAFLAVDIETTGLNPKRDDILSVGWVSMQCDRIDLGDAGYRLVRAARAIPEAIAIVHRITDDQAARGDLLDDVLAELLEKLVGKVMIAHHATVEKNFLNAVCQRLYGVGVPVPAIDTQVLAKRTLERRHITCKDSDLRLHALCEHYNLPRYGAHNALNDALAAAELFLAQASYRDRGKEIPLRDFLTW